MVRKYLKHCIDNDNYFENSLLMMQVIKKMSKYGNIDAVLLDSLKKDLIFLQNHYKIVKK